METLFWLVGALFAGLASGLALSHVLEIPGKRDMDEGMAAGVQRRLYRGYRVPAAVIEAGALGAIVIAAILTPGNSTSFWLTVAAAGTTVAAFIVFVTVTERQNRRILHWSAGTLPSDWKETRSRWEFSHGIRAALFLMTLGLLAGAMMSS